MMLSAGVLVPSLLSISDTNLHTSPLEQLAPSRLRSDQSLNKQMHSFGCSALGNTHRHAKWINSANRSRAAWMSKVQLQSGAPGANGAHVQLLQKALHCCLVLAHDGVNRRACQVDVLSGKKLGNQCPVLPLAICGCRVLKAVHAHIAREVA